MGPGVAVECKEAQDGLHVPEDHFYVEVIDPETLEPVPDGRDGELVFTSLTKEALPVIRYRTGDIASINREKCRCGRTTLRISRIKGRIDDMLIIRGVNVFPSEIESALLNMKELVPHYQLEIANDGALDKVLLHVEIREPVFRSIGEDLQHEYARQLKNEISRQIKNKCFVHMDVNLVPPMAIPRSEGKAIRIIRKKKSASMPI